ncbi:NHLP family bacteriocin export ABC transporter peptidase/permease/ATPase subunit [Labrys wisconsinensis]|nr:NHLP family bacteriocin export ABC transporter peptidase/permease/ATPase subunit [Labrys wisconsinensis]
MLRSAKRSRQAGKRRSTPTVFQMEAVECGAAALAMILAFHRRWVPLEELRFRCGVSRDGTKASNILKAARHYGLAAKGFRKEPEDLTSLPIPSIIHWNFNHFVVFEGFVGKWAYLNDPAIGRCRVDAAEFSESFTGVVLAMEPAAGFRAEGSPPSLLGLLWQRLRGSGDGVALVLLLSVLLAIPGILTPLFAKIFIDDVLIGRLDGWLAPLFLGMAATAAVRAALIFVQTHYLLRLETKLALSLGSRFVWHLLRLPMVFFTQRHAGDIANRIQANDDMARLLSGGLATLALSLVTSLVFLAAMAAFNPGLTAIVVPIALIDIAALWLAWRRREATAQRLMKDRGQLMSATVGIVRAIETVKASGLEQDAFGRWAGHHARTMAASRDLGRSAAMLDAVPPLLAGLGHCALLGVGSLEVMAGRMSVGDLVAFLALAAAFSDPVGQMLGIGATLQEMRGGLANIRDVLASPPDPRLAPSDDRQAAAPMPPRTTRLRGQLDLHAVTFGYNPQEPPLIADFSLSVQPGMRIGIVGASGSGKSTLGRLISGLHVPWSGSILIDGVAAQDIPRPILARSLAYVDQDIFLFQGSVRDNVTLWDRSLEDAAVLRALKDAAVFEEITVRPGLQHAHVAEAGINFSGGQRQRLEIARALVEDPAILVLDEAMAALDPIVEQAIDDNIRRRGCTCIIIAHRLSTIRDCDEIVMLRAGRVIGRGRHPELLASCPDYRHLIDAQ